VKEYYFTGGEPFLHPDLVPILEATLELGPATVLTNGTLFKPLVVERLARAEAQSLYSLEFRVSLDGASPESNDAIRGRGAFERTMGGIRLLLEKGFLPVVTVAQTWDDGREVGVFEDFVSMLRQAGYPHPRIKIIPTLRIGAEVNRHRGYEESERVTEELLSDFDVSSLICTRSRVVTQRGVYVCPILLDSPDARLGASLSDSLGSFAISHGACFTCYLGGSICANPSAGAGHVG
jgi:MoaA/NifB/PqqE/SkfB family radical SAM enzyme